MAKPKNTDGAIEDLGVLITAAYGLDTDWMIRGSCYKWAKNRPGHPTPWQVAPGKKYVSPPDAKPGQPTTILSGTELVKYALIVCSGCPAQYECAQYAVDAKMDAGTWSMPITQLRWLKEREDAVDLIRMARDNKIPMQHVAGHVAPERSGIVCGDDNATDDPVL